MEAAMGGNEFSQSYKEKLETEIKEHHHENFTKRNDSKYFFAAAKTNAVLFAIMFACYMVAGFLGFMRLESLANLFILIMRVALVGFITWAYVQYSGNHREIGTYIDMCADKVWENVSMDTGENY